MTGKSIIAALLMAALPGAAAAQGFEIEIGDGDLRLRIGEGGVEVAPGGEEPIDEAPIDEEYVEEGEGLGEEDYASETEATPLLIPLTLFWSPDREDNFTAASNRGRRAARNAYYDEIRSEACILAEPAPETAPLDLYWHPVRGDNFSTATPRGARDADSAGYSFVRTQGYVFVSEQPGTVPLELYWSRDREDNFSAATTRGARAAQDAGYRFVRIEGYVFPGSDC